MSFPNSWASVSLSYSGRLVNNNGSPVTGVAILKFDLAYSNQTGVVLCSQTLSGVDLSHGVFHVSLSFPACNLSQILADTPDGHTVSIRVVDLTGGGEKKYSYQAIHSVPFSVTSMVSKQLAPLNATTGQVLTWDGTKWAPANTANAVGSVVTTNGLVSSSSSGVVTIGIIDGASSGDVLVWNGVSWGPGTAGLAAETDPNVRSFARKDALTIPVCDPDYKLEYALAVEQFVCSPIVLDSQVEDAINDGVTDLAPSQNAVADALALKQDQINNTTDVTVKSLKIMSSGSSWMGFQSPATSNNLFFTLPDSYGNNGEFLKTDGAGNLVWGSPTVANGTIGDAQISSITTSKVTGLDGTLTSLTNSVSTINTTLGSLTTDNIPEGSKLYFEKNRVLGTDLSGLNTAAGSILSSDTVLSSIGKLTGNIEGVKNDYVKKDGTSVMEGNLNLDSNKIVNLSDPVDDQDAATKKYIDDEIIAVSHWEKTGTDLSYLEGQVSVGTKMRLKSTTANFLEFQAPDSMSADKVYIFPASDTGKSGQVLTTNGAGVLSWSEVATTSTSVGGDLTGTIATAIISNGAVTYNKMTISDGELPLAKVNGLQAALDGKEPEISAGTISQYWAGNKSWRDFDSDVRGSLLSGYGVLAGTVSNGDTLLQALGKLDGGIAALNANGQWSKNGADVYYNGNVGIGISIPLSPLHVNGSIRAQEICDLSGGNCKNISSGWGNVSAASMVANWPDAILCDDGLNKSIMYHDTRENAANLEYYSKASSGHMLRFNATTGAFYDATAFTGVSACSGKSIATLVAEGRTYGLLGGGVDWTSTNGTDIFRSGGNVGIGTNIPEQALSVSGSVRIGTPLASENWGNQSMLQAASPLANQGYLEVPWIHTRFIETDQRGATASGIALGSFSGFTNPDEIAIVTNAVNRLHVNSSGNVGIGTQTPTAKLDVEGEIAKHARPYPWHWSTESNGLISVTTPVWTDIPGASITYTLPANADVRVNFEGSMVANTVNNHCSIAIIMDTVNTGDSMYGNLIVMGTTGEHWNSFTRSKWFKNQAAGTHTVKLQLKSVNSGECSIADLEYSRVHMEVMGYSPN